jgi:hypothetical protein
MYNNAREIHTKALTRNTASKLHPDQMKPNKEQKE